MENIHRLPNSLDYDLGDNKGHGCFQQDRIREAAEYWAANQERINREAREEFEAND